jgi:hypothetical protein
MLTLLKLDILNPKLPFQSTDCLFDLTNGYFQVIFGKYRDEETDSSQ